MNSNIVVASRSRMEIVAGSSPMKRYVGGDVHSVVNVQILVASFVSKHECCILF